MALLSRVKPLPGVLAFFTVVTAWMLLPQVTAPFSVFDLGDPLLSIWRLAWVAHPLPRDPMHLFDANIFHLLPNRQSIYWRQEVPNKPERTRSRTRPVASTGAAVTIDAEVIVFRNDSPVDERTSRGVTDAFGRFTFTSDRGGSGFRVRRSGYHFGGVTPGNHL